MTLTGYADKFTGTPDHNMELSEERAKRVRECLVDSGIAPSRITIKYFGDTRQVSTVPEQNRVVTCVTR